MKTIKTTICLLVCTLCLSLTADAQDNSISVDFDGYDANIEIIKEYTNTMNSGDATKLSSFFTDDAMIIGLGGISDTINKKQHLEMYTANFAQNTYDVNEGVNLSIRIGEGAQVPPGDYGFSWGTVSSTSKSTKKTAMTSYHVVTAINDGKIAMMWFFYDTMPFVLRDGATIMPPKKM
jgi:hypothetical protein